MRAGLVRAANTLLARQLARRWRNSPTLSSALSEPHRILVVELGGLGDAVCLLPAFDALRARFPRADFSLVCRDYAAGLFDLVAPGYLNVVGITKSRTGFKRAHDTLRHTQWDLVVSTCWSTWTTALALKLHAVALVGFWRPSRVECHGFRGDTTPVVTCEDHLSLLRWKAVAPLGIAIPAPVPAPRLAPREHDWQSALKRHPTLAQPYTVLVPFSDNANRSLSTAEARDLQDIIRRQGQRVLLVGGRREASRLRSLGADCISDLTIPEFAAVLAHADAVVSVVTAAAHLAAAAGTRTFVVCKAIDPGPNAPVGLNVRAARLDLSDTQRRLAEWLSS